MSILRDQGIIYEIMSGAHRGRQCIIISPVYVGLPGSFRVTFNGENTVSTVNISMGELAVLDTPGWEIPSEHKRPSYGLEKHKRVFGTGLNRLRIDGCVAQPRVLHVGDILATVDEVTEECREGGNGSSLVRFKKFGWIDIAARLPVALSGNDNFKLPIELRNGDELITGCKIVKDSQSNMLNLTNIYLDEESCCIAVPSCIPLALA